MQRKVAKFSKIGVKYNEIFSAKYSKDKLFKFSFFNRYVTLDDWNSIPNSVMAAPSLKHFKCRLFNYLRS